MVKVGEYLLYLTKLAELLAEPIEMDNHRNLKTILDDANKLRSLIIDIINAKNYLQLPKVRILIHSLIEKIPKSNPSLLISFLEQHKIVVQKLLGNVAELKDAVNEEVSLFELMIEAKSACANLKKLLNEYRIDLSDLIFADFPSYQYVRHQNLILLRNAISVQQVFILKIKTNISITTKIKIQKLQKKCIDLIELTQHDPNLLPNAHKILFDLVTRLSSIAVYFEENQIQAISIQLNPIQKFIQRQIHICEESSTLIQTFSEENFTIIERMRNCKDAFDLKIKTIRDITNAHIRKINQILDALTKIRMDFKKHREELSGFLAPVNSLPLPDSNWADLIKQYQFILSEINVAFNAFENDRDRLFASGLLSTQLQKLNTNDIPFNSSTIEKVKESDKCLRQSLTETFPVISDLTKKCGDINDGITHELKLIKTIESSALKKPNNYAAVGSEHFLRIKETLINSHSFDFLSNHRLKKPDKAAAIDKYLKKIQSAKNLDELVVAVKSNPSKNGVALRMNTGLNLYQLFHHGYKSTCDEYASKLDQVLRTAITRKAFPANH